MLCGDTAHNSLCIKHHEGSWISFPRHINGSTDMAVTNYPNFMVHKYLHGAWRGHRNHWQNLTIVYNSQLSIMHFYVNGCLIESLTSFPDSKPKLTSMHLGKYLTNDAKFFNGYMSSFRLYGSALNSQQVNFITHRDYTSQI